VRRDGGRRKKGLRERRADEGRDPERAFVERLKHYSESLSQHMRMLAAGGFLGLKLASSMLAFSKPELPSGDHVGRFSLLHGFQYCDDSTVMPELFMPSFEEPAAHI
jgi:hypothetical protein